LNRKTAKQIERFGRETSSLSPFFIIGRKIIFRPMTVFSDPKALIIEGAKLPETQKEKK
jgi:hypothetical protein